MTATVVDRDGHLVTGLPIEAFEIFEEGERQTITQFTNERVPVSLAVLLDVSDSMFGQRLVDARSAVERFLFELLDENDEFSVVAFNHEPRALTRWTQAPDVVRTAMADAEAVRLDRALRRGADRAADDGHADETARLGADHL